MRCVDSSWENFTRSLNNIENHEVLPYGLGMLNKQDLIDKKDELDGFRPLDPHFVKNLEDWFRVELTYTSNAIEGNTLTRQETALVVEKGLTVGGKSLVEHLEARNHAKALDWVKSVAADPNSKVTEKDIIAIHDLILRGIEDYNAGTYRSVPVRISGSRVILPNPLKVPSLMEEFAHWLSTSDLHPIDLAAEAHYRLVTIHPFVDGNGRTARLLMNLILLKNGFPPALIRKRDRLKYITSLEKAQLGQSKDDYQQIIYQAIDRSFDIYLKALHGENEVESRPHKHLLKIGELAKKSSLTNATIRHWTALGLLEVQETTDSGYQLYSESTLDRIKKIQDLKDKRNTLQEILKELNPE